MPARRATVRHQSGRARRKFQEARFTKKRDECRQPGAGWRAIAALLQPVLTFVRGVSWRPWSSRRHDHFIECVPLAQRPRGCQLWCSCNAGLTARPVLRGGLPVSRGDMGNSSTESTVPMRCCGTPRALP